jgi:phage gp36-like protein
MYCTTDDVTLAIENDRLVELTSNSGEVINEGRLADAISFQSDFMDSYLISRYAVPIIEPPTVLAALKVHCVRLVIWNLFQGRLLAENYDGFRQDKDETLSWLKSIRDGKTSLTGAPAPVIPEDATGGFSFSSDEQVFGGYPLA